MNEISLIIITVFIIALGLIIGILNLIQNRKNKKIKSKIEELEFEKNSIESAPILPELSKIEAFLKNEKIEIMYNDWKKRLNEIKNNQIPKITDMLIEAEYSLTKMDYSGIIYKLAKLEIEIYKVKTNSEFLLEEIKEITTSDEKNRAIITKLKTRYRELYQKFLDHKIEFGIIANAVTLQFENIAMRFEKFEEFMENNEYTEVTQIIKAIDDMLKHMEVVVQEVPIIVMTATNVLPKKISEIQKTYDLMVRDGYSLGYLNVEYNIEEANKKIEDIFARLKVLNLEDSLFELKVLLDYFDSLFNDFEKEKVNKATYEENRDGFKVRLDRINKLINDIFSQIDEVKKAYNLSIKDINLLNEVRKEINELNKDYNTLMGHTSNNTFAFSKLVSEIENLNLKLARLEDRLDNSLDAIGSMKEDEMRARQQLEEVNFILKESKRRMREYKLPIVPNSYRIQLNEASAAIREVIVELGKSPITISILNTRVDTARDLVLKLYNTTKEMLKTAMFAEMAIVYGNRFRSSIIELDKNLLYSETLFFRGLYHKSLEFTINSLNKFEPGIYDKLVRLYGQK